MPGGWFVRFLACSVVLVVGACTGRPEARQCSASTACGAHEFCQDGRCVVQTGAYRISGTIAGVVPEGSVAGVEPKGITISLEGAMTKTTAADTRDGLYAFDDLARGTYSVTPSHYGYSFSPASATIVIDDTNVQQDFVATADTYSIRGLVNGPDIAGVIVSLSGMSNSTRKTTNTDAGGNYVFAEVTNGSYAITPSKNSYAFSPASLTVTVNGGDQTAPNFTGVPSSPNVVFVTSTTYVPGALGGLAGADSACQARAAAAGLTGTFRAWLSTSGTSGVNAIDRLGNTRGWVRPDGNPFADTLADIWNGRLMYPPRLDEFGNDLGQVYVTTGTSGEPLADGTTCGNYTDSTNSGFVLASGFSSGGSWVFTAMVSSACSDPQHLYCFGVDRNVTVTPTPVTGRRAFITDEVFTAGGGLDAADALCVSEATAAGLSGTFVAALATTTASVQSRFQTSGAPWVRADGLALAPSAAALFTTQYLDVSPTNAAGTKYYSGSNVWSGAASWSSKGTAASTCSDYTTTAGTAGIAGLLGDTQVAWLVGSLSGISCEIDARVLCMEQ